MKILVIEDDADIASNIGQYFEDKGHQLDFAYNGNHGLTLASSQRFDLIILDHSMPGLTGEETCRKLQEIDPTARVIISSGYDRSEVSRHFSDLGMAGFLQKPYDAHELINEVNRNLGLQLAF